MSIRMYTHYMCVCVHVYISHPVDPMKLALIWNKTAIANLCGVRCPQRGSIGFALHSGADPIPRWQTRWSSLPSLWDLVFPHTSVCSSGTP